MKKTKETKEEIKEITEPFDMKKEINRITANQYYTSQEIRITGMNNLRDIIRRKVENLPQAKVEGKKKPEDKYKKLYTDDKLKELIVLMLKDEKLSQEEFDYLNQVISVKEEAEKVNMKYKDLMMVHIAKEPVYQEFLSKIKGIGPVISCRLIKEFGNCEKAPHIASLWKYCGYHTVDGHAPKRAKGVKLDFNIQLRSFVWNIADSFVKKRTAVYRRIYDAERVRQNSLIEQDAPNKPANQKQADLRARRKIAKLFLSHYWTASRELNGLPLSDPYPFAKLGHSPQHLISWKDVVAECELDKLKPKIKKVKIKAN